MKTSNNGGITSDGTRPRERGQPRCRSRFVHSSRFLAHAPRPDLESTDLQPRPSAALRSKADTHQLSRRWAPLEPLLHARCTISFDPLQLSEQLALLRSVSVSCGSPSASPSSGHALSGHRAHASTRMHDRVVSVCEFHPRARFNSLSVAHRSRIVCSMRAVTSQRSAHGDDGPAADDEGFRSVRRFTGLRPSRRATGFELRGCVRAQSMCCPSCDHQCAT